MDGVAVRLLLTFLLATAISGCGWFGGSEEEEFAEDLPTLDAAVTSAPSISTANNITGAALAEPEPVIAIAPGMRIPMRRRVEQTLTQGDVVSKTTLELDFSISIDEIVEDGGRRFGVHYDRVRYSGSFAGASFFEYDSKSTGAAPVQALPFQGLVNNSFYFWIDRAGQIKLVGFDRFLRRCVEGLPHAEREAVLSQLTAISDEEGVSRFVDENVGLLGGSQPGQISDVLKSGKPWTRLRRLKGAVPTNVLTIYTVESLNGNDVKIKISGTISPTDDRIITVSNRGVPSITVKSGRASGTCTIDLKTGLPTASRIEQSIEMSVQLADGTRFDQRKFVVTTTERLASE